MSGMAYTFNTNRMFFNRLTDATLEAYGEIDNDKLYRVITGMYSAQMLGTVKSKSLGLLSLEPKMADGSLVTDFDECIIYDKDGNEVKEWYALASYLQSFGKDGIPSTYSAPDGRKDVSHSLNPIQLLKNPNWITLVVLLVLAIVIAVVVLILRAIVNRLRGRRYGGRRSGRYRG